ncbi:DHS-like NAD/FAD-binding domain-containing protein [Neoconidiobolus thromboides FSU 785]|nr:DHS-like NAD/FAD-binding domain-containing protein [Neoconidiobolus thromboides FSU 785]
MSTIATKTLKEISLKDQLLKAAINNLNQGGMVVLTGAGISTDSGIPDYRGPNGAYVVNPGFKPITYQHFASSHERRQRYWTRSYFGFPKFSTSKPNASHFALAALEQQGYVKHVITQNVDNLHQKAGTKNVTEIHGTLSFVECLSCKHQIKRESFQEMLSDMNPKWHNYLQQFENSKTQPQTTPDGDILLPDNTPFNLFNIPSCLKCNDGFYKPSVVFFGENMKQKAREEAKFQIENTSSLLVIGSSLATPSAYRLALSAKNNGKQVYILNLGPTRADDLADLKVEQNSSIMLTYLLENLK